MSSTQRQPRQYVRIPSIVPVDFQLRDQNHEVVDPEIRTAFTRDLSEAGMCLEVRSVPPAVAGLFVAKSADLTIEVDIDLPSKVLRVPGRVAWRSPTQSGRNQGWLLGIEFKNLAAADADAIAAYARRAALRPKLVRAALGGFALLTAFVATLYVWQGKQLTEDLESSRRALEKTEQRYVAATDKLGDNQVDLRWVAVRLRDLADQVDTQQGRAPKSPAQAPASIVDDLKDSVERLSVALKPARE